MRKYFCDICGQPLTLLHPSCYKIKKLECSWGESWWEKIDVHEDCWKELCKQVADKRKELKE